MYHGTNTTALQSQEWLASALSTLMLYTPYSKITIRDLCISADLSRQTFYNVFDSKDEVLHFCLQREYEKQFLNLAQNVKISITDIINEFISFSEMNRTLLDNMIENHLEGVITEEIANCISLYAKQFVKSEKENEMLPYSVAMLSGALAQLQLFWFKQEQPIDNSKLTCLLSNFFNGNLYTL